MPQVQQQMTFSAGIFVRGQLRRGIAQFLDQRKIQGLRYELHEYKDWLDSDFLLILRGPEELVKTSARSLQEWLKSFQ